MSLETLGGHGDTNRGQSSMHSKIQPSRFNPTKMVERPNAMRPAVVNSYINSVLEMGAV